MIDREIADQLYDPPPRRWRAAMEEGITKSSDVRDPRNIVRRIWRSLSKKKKAEIKEKEQKGETFRYNLPLPEDHPTHGTGTIRMVKPFQLAEIQANVSPAVFERLRKSGMFQTMRRQDGSTALVKRCKSEKGNCNIFLDKE